MAEKRSRVLARGKEIIAIEAEALHRVGSRLDASFQQAVRLLCSCTGTVVVTGVGKSGNIAQKIVATLSSTGTPSVFLHPTDALHGDLGVVRSADVVIILSKSGNSTELNDLLPVIRSLTTDIIAITGESNSFLATNSRIVLDCSVHREACSLDLAPTASTTAMLALGDALAIVVSEEKGITRESFAATHPAGVLGKRLLLKIKDLMKTGDKVPTVNLNSVFTDIIVEMSSKRLGCTLVVSGKSKSKLEGIITDGDLRRRLGEFGETIHNRIARELMTTNPMFTYTDVLAVEALELLEKHKRTQLPVLDSRDRLVGIVHLHDLIEAGLS